MWEMLNHSSDEDFFFCLIGGVKDFIHIHTKTKKIHVSHRFKVFRQILLTKSFNGMKFQ